MHFSFGPAVALMVLLSGAAPSGGVYVTTLPSGADVWMDGTYCGPSPVLVDALPQGRHTLTLTKNGWNVQEVDVDIPGGGIALSSTKLVAAARGAAGKASGTIVIHGLANGAKVSIDGGAPRELRGQASLPVGSHSVAFGGARRTIRSFTVLPDMTSELVLHQEPASAESRAGVIAPATDYLPPESIALDDRKLVIRYLRHEVVARIGQNTIRLDGTAVSYDSAPSVINGKLYLPLDLLDTLTK